MLWMFFDIGTDLSHVVDPIFLTSKVFSKFLLLEPHENIRGVDHNSIYSLFQSPKKRPIPT